MSSHHAQLQQNAFTLPDLVAIVAVVTILGTCLGFSLLGEKGRTARCARNLALLGTLMQEFANDHGSALPPAVIDQQHIAWDMQIGPYLSPKQVKAGMDPFFTCPSDQLPRTRPRSYAMSEHDMMPVNWPPGPDNETGLGLSWNKDNLKKLLGDKIAATVETNNNSLETLALVKLSWLPKPADTILLTEFINPRNNLKDIGGVVVGSAGEQTEALKDKRIHGGRFNYLMADGHVELLSPLETGGSGGFDADRHYGLWSIRKAGQ